MLRHVTRQRKEVGSAGQISQLAASTVHEATIYQCLERVNMTLCFRRMRGVPQAVLASGP
jgi:hypothetical protein